MAKFTYLYGALLLCVCALLPRTTDAAVCGAVSLTAVAKGTLPRTMYNARASWDGLLNIYIFGGMDANGNLLNTIYSYNLVTSQVSQAATLPSARYSGVVLKDWLTPDILPSFFYIGVDNDQSPTDPIYKFNPTLGLNQVSLVGTIQRATEGMAAAETTGSMAYIFGGPDYPWANISTFDMSTGEVDIVGDLTLGLPSVGTAVYYESTGNITIVGSAVAGSYRDTRVLSFNDSIPASDLMAAIDYLPELDHSSSAVDPSEDNMWVVGGYQNVDIDDIHATQGIYQINLTTFDGGFVPVANFPNNGSKWLSGTSAVWVSSGYKIFFFGGIMRDSSLPLTTPGVAVNNIWMIDYTPQYCCGRSNGLFPHPDDCKKFIQCSNQVTNFFSCPLLLKFNPLTQACDFVTNVVCVVSGILP